MILAKVSTACYWSLSSRDTFTSNRDYSGIKTIKNIEIYVCFACYMVVQHWLWSDSYLRSIPKQLSKPALVCYKIPNLGAIFNYNSNICIEEYEFENLVYKMASISYRSQCVSLDM